MWLLIKLAWRSLWRNRRRTIITITSIGFSLSLAVFFIAFADGMYADLIDDAVRMQAGHLTVEHREYRDAPAVDLTIAEVGALRRRIEALDNVSGTKLLAAGQGVARSGLGAIGVAIVGVEPEIEGETSPLADKIVAGRYLEPGDTRKVVVGDKLAERLELESERDLKRIAGFVATLVAPFGLEPERIRSPIRVQLAVGKKLVLTSSDIDGEITQQMVRVKGVFSTGAVEIDGYFTQIPYAFARQLYGMQPDQATQLGVLLDDPADREAVGAAVAEMLPLDAAVRSWEEVLPDLAAYIRIDGGSNYVFQGILIFLVMFTIFNTILMSVLERKREFAVLLALGTPTGRIKAQILLETVFIALIGVAIGLGLGGGVGYYFQVHGLDLRQFYADGMSVSGMAIDPVIRAMVTPGMLATVGGLVFGATLLLSLYPMGRVERISVADVLR